MHFEKDRFYCEDAPELHAAFEEIYGKKWRRFGSMSLARLKQELSFELADAERRIQEQAEPDEEQSRIEALQAALGLTRGEALVVAFAAAAERFDALPAVLGCVQTNKRVKRNRAFAFILGVKVGEIEEAFAERGRLYALNLLVDRSMYGLDEWWPSLGIKAIAEWISGTIPLDAWSLLKDTIVLCPAPTLTIEDYDHLAEPVQLLENYLRVALAEKRKGVNILIYGPPGTGKTQLTRVLASRLGHPLLEVIREARYGECVSGRDRIGAYRLAQRLLRDAAPQLIVFDEFEDAFDRVAEHDDGWRRRASETSKGWFTLVLEENAMPAFWIGNSVVRLDAALARRFDIVLEMPAPPRRKRYAILDTESGGLLTAQQIRRIADHESATPAIVSRARAVIRAVEPGFDAAQRARLFERLIEETLKAQGHGKLRVGETKSLPSLYDPSFVNASENLATLAEGLLRHGGGRLCLHGLPGTGKSAFARWLAQRLDRPLVLRRASDLLSMWVGGTEKNIAKAFEEAREEGAVLLIDEADSFLRDRRSAHQSWEVSQVNEMLTQMEAFDGVFIASTNLMTDLDAAALRRFDLKITFRPLQAAQAQALLVRSVAALGLDPPRESALKAVARLSLLTPGDFATVMRLHRLHPLADADAVVSALAAECALKERVPSPIGFVPT
jgi:SpoVK/Ycf46/Vps4 family AAA+-type ATPase